MVQSKLLGTGLSAKCVLTPGLKCKKTKKNQLSKVVQKPEEEIHKQILDRELLVSKLIESMKPDKLTDRFITIDSMCELDFNLNKGKKKFIDENCDLETKHEYLLLNMRNGGCPPNKSSNGKCGNLTNKSTCKYLSKDIKGITKYLLEGLLFLHSLNIVHMDIKPLNLVCDTKGKVRFIDYGSSIYLKNKNKGKEEFKTICKSLQDILNEKSKNYKTLDLFNMKIAALTIKYTPPEIATCKAFLNKGNIEFSELYMQLIFDNKLEDSNDLRKLCKRLHARGLKLLNDIFCIKNPYIYKFDVYSLGRTIQDICEVSETNINGDLKDLLEQMTHIDYKKRISVKDAMNHIALSR